MPADGGVRVLCARILKKGRRVWVQVWRRLFRNRHHLVVWDDTTVIPKDPSGMSVVCYEREADLPESFLRILEQRQGQRGLDTLRSEFRNRGLLWLGVINDEPVGYLWTRRGSDFARWYVPLNDDDQVIFAMVTMPEWRGHGIAPTLMRHVVSNRPSEGSKVYGDIVVWNGASLHAAEKVGFRRFATMKPIREDCVR